VTLRKRTRNLEWRERTTGAVTYVGDVQLPGMLVGKALRSPHPHAEIRSIDVSAAERLPGVHAVLTSADLPENKYPHEGAFADRYPLARDKVRFIGQEVAIVAAEDERTARAALEAIRVDYHVLPAVTTVDEAMAQGAVRIHERQSGSNLSMRITRSYGDVDAGRAATHASARASFRFNRQTHVCMETNGTVASWHEETGILELWTSTQSPYFVRKEVSAVLDLPRDSVIVRETAVGGGFGAKSKITDHEVLAAALSMRTRRPVRLVLDRAEEFATTKTRHDFRTDLEIGATADGLLTFRDARMVIDNGAYNHSGVSVTGASIGSMVSLYRTMGVAVDAQLIDTNKQPGGQFRGYGGPQVALPVEVLMDELADKLGLDPIDLRIRNAHHDGDVTHAGYELGTANLVECLERVREATDWDTKRAAGGTGRGIGVAVAMHVSGARTYPEANEGNASVAVDALGRATVRFGGSDAGTGQKQMLADIVQAETGVAAGMIEVLMMDTERSPVDLGAFSSRGTMISGHATRAAAQEAARRLRELAAHKLGVEPEQVVLAEGRAHVDKEPDAGITLGDLVASAGLDDDTLEVTETVTVKAEMVNYATGVANLSPAYSFTAHVAEVEVDQRTGKVTVLRYTAAHDSGTILNPTSFDGQVAGGVLMGLGAALGEELVYEGGRLVNPSYLTYGLRRAADAPEIVPIIVERADPEGPYGAKGIGEIGIDPVAPAIVNAVNHAVGVRITELPLTPDKVLTALRPPPSRRAYHLWRRPSRWWIALLRWSYPHGVHAVLHRVGTRFARKAPPVVVPTLHTPETVDEAVATLAATPGAAPLGGGTDLIPLGEQALRRPTAFVDLMAVRQLRTLRREPDGTVVIGGAVTLAELLGSPELAAFPAVEEAVRTIASSQVREMATVAGNLCQEKRCWFYRSGFDCYKRGGATCPCYAVTGDSRYQHAVIDGHRCQAVTPSDLATVLTALDAELEIASRSGSRRLPVASLYSGPGETVLRDGDVVVAVRVPPARGRTTVFRKLQLWEGDFAVASAAVSVHLAPDGTLGAPVVVLGALAPTPYRAHRVERALEGRRLEDAVIARAARAWVPGAHPLERNEWKVEAACGLLETTLEALR
jgi:CO/xanthine dehydrogenase Mo-binding subunit/CO/xanthine dehydrogenase FAD-binding subunit